MLEMKTNIAQLRELSQWAKDRLIGAGIIKVRDLVKKTAAELLEIPRFGEKCLAEVTTILASAGFSLALVKAGTSIRRLGITQIPQLTIQEQQLLVQANICTVGDLLERRAAAIRAIFRFDPVAWAHLEEFLQSQRLTLK